MARTVFFFLPYIWWVEKKIAQLQEIPKTTYFSAGFASRSLELLKKRIRALQSINQLNRRRMAVTGVVMLVVGFVTVIPWQLAETQTLPFNLCLNYLPWRQFELSANVMLPGKKIKKITVLIDGKPLTFNTTYNANGMYFGFTRPNDDIFPQEGPHKVTVKAQTTTGLLMDQHWIYFHDSLIWSSQNLGLESKKTLIKIGPFFGVLNNRSMFLTHIF